MKILFSNISQFLIAKIITIHNGSLIAKFNSLLILAIAFLPISLIDNVREWLLENSSYVYFVLIAVLFDFLLGIIVDAFWKRDFSVKKGIIGLTVKLGLVFAVGTLMEGFKAIIGSSGLVIDGTTIVFRIMVFLYPTISALYNSAIITGGKFPPFKLIEKFEKINKDLDLSEFKEKPNDGEN